MIALTGLIVLFASACSTSRSVTSERLQLTAYSLQDTLREQVVVTVIDTIKEVTTITVRESETGDTLRMTTVTDRERVRSMSDVRSKKEDVYVRTDTVYIEREADKTVAVAGPGTEIDEQGNIRHQPSYIRLLKWVFWILLAIIALVLLIRLLPRK